MVPLAYGRSTRRWLTRRILLTSGAACLIAVIVLALLGMRAAFSYTSICPICGEIQETTEWQLPFTQVTYHTSTYVASSPLSRIISKRHPVGLHAHQWQFCIGGGNGVRCALGDGRGLFMEAR